MYILRINNKGLKIKGNWIIPLLHKADGLGFKASVCKYENNQLVKTYKKVNGQVKSQWKK